LFVQLSATSRRAIGISGFTGTIRFALVEGFIATCAWRWPTCILCGRTGTSILRIIDAVAIAANTSTSNISAACATLGVAPVETALKAIAPLRSALGNETLCSDRDHANGAQ
jgi:hypothetical protein